MIAAAPAAEPGAALARDMHALVIAIAALVGDVAERADDALAGGTLSAKAAAHQLIAANRLIAATALGEEATR
jgi:hypothetical protein